MKPLSETLLFWSYIEITKWTKNMPICNACSIKRTLEVSVSPKPNDRRHGQSITLFLLFNLEPEHQTAVGAATLTILHLLLVPNEALTELGHLC